MNTQLTVSTPFPVFFHRQDNNRDALTLRKTTPEPIAIDLFIARNQDLLACLTPSQLARQLSLRLQATPVSYNTVLDGIALLRAFAPAPPAYTPCHYALLMQGWQIVGLCWIPCETKRADFDQDGPLVSYPSESRAVLRAAIEANATKVVVATTRHDPDWYWLGESEKHDISQLTIALDVIGVELVDYLLLLPKMNISHGWELYGENGIEEAVTIGQLSTFYCPALK